ncbi:MAG: hypothetical protein ORN98_05800 [Alphaproteobacteria bacterium]|nr:hypothetical protein [Alphaproteobacteria bacterium]
MSNSLVRLSRSAIEVNLNAFKTINPVAAAKAELKSLLTGTVRHPPFQKAHLSKSLLLNAQA